MLVSTGSAKDGSGTPVSVGRSVLLCLRQSIRVIALWSCFKAASPTHTVKWHRPGIPAAHALTGSRCPHTFRGMWAHSAAPIPTRIVRDVDGVGDRHDVCRIDT